MADLQNSSSFIPKRSAGEKVRQKRSNNFFILSIISYACLIAAPTASAAVYVYKMYIERQFDQAVSQLETAIGSFSEADMSRVLEFDKRLRYAKGLVDNHVSVVKALAVLEQTTASEVGFKSLELARQDDNSITIEADIVAPNFDAALFQNITYNNKQLMTANTELSDIAFAAGEGESAGESVTMKGKFNFSPDTILFTVTDQILETTGQAVTPAESSSDDSEDTMTTTTSSSTTTETESTVSNSNNNL